MLSGEPPGALSSGQVGHFQKQGALGVRGSRSSRPSLSVIKRDQPLGWNGNATDRTVGVRSIRQTPLKQSEASELPRDTSETGRERTVEPTSSDSSANNRNAPNGLEGPVLLKVGWYKRRSPSTYKHSFTSNSEELLLHPGHPRAPPVANSQLPGAWPCARRSRPPAARSEPCAAERRFGGRSGSRRRGRRPGRGGGGKGKEDAAPGREFAALTHGLLLDFSFQF